MNLDKKNSDYIKILNLYNTKINYKNIKLLEYFLTYDGKIISRTITLINAKTHHIIAKAIKRARILKLIPFIYKIIL